MKLAVPALFLFLFAGLAFTVNYVSNSAGQDCCSLESLQLDNCCENAADATAAASLEGSVQVHWASLPFENTEKSVENVNNKNCDPSLCDPSDCDLSKCDLSKCDLSKCNLPQGGQAKCAPQKGVTSL